MKFFPLGDNLSFKERKLFNVSLKETNCSIFSNPNDGFHMKAVRTEEFRAPRRGEWYLSGARPTAYKAPNDFSSQYRIMRLIKVERKTTISWNEC